MQRLVAFARAYAVNVGVFVALCFAWGIPAVAIVWDADPGLSPLLTGAAAVLVVLLFGGFLFAAQVLVYSILLALVPWRRRMFAVALAPIATGILWVVADDGATELVLLLAFTVSLGLSAKAPGQRVWWQGQPRALVAAAGMFAVACVVAGLTQGRPSPDRTSLVFTVTGDGATRRWGLECRYDRAGRMRSSPPPPAGLAAHPSGTRACAVLKGAEEQILEERLRTLNETCAQGAPTARIHGVYRDRRLRDLRVAGTAACEETYLIDDEPAILVP